MSLTRLGLRACANAHAPPILSAVATIGANIKRLREKHTTLSQGALARALGLPASRVNDWERGRYKSMEIKWLLKIAAAIGRPVEELVEGLDADYDRLGLTQSDRRASTNDGGGHDAGTASAAGTKHAGARGPAHRKAAHAQTRLEEPLATEVTRLRALLKEIEDAADITAKLARQREPGAGGRVASKAPAHRRNHRTRRG